MQTMHGRMGFSGDIGLGLIVAVADTGVDFGHPDLNGTCQARKIDRKIIDKASLKANNSVEDSINPLSRSSGFQ